MATKVFDEQRMRTVLTSVFNDVQRFPLGESESRTYNIGGWAKWVVTHETLTLMRTAQPSLGLVEAKMIGIRRSYYSISTLNEIVAMVVNRFGNKNIVKWPLCALHPHQPILAKSENDDACEKCAYQQITYTETCAICLDETRTHSLWVENTGCQHCFHAECFSNVERRCNGEQIVRCPLCREPYHPIVM